MKKFLKNKLIIYGTFIIILSIICLIYTLLLYFQKVSPLEKDYAIISFCIGAVCFLLLGLISGIVSKKNGLIEGLLSGVIVILISLLVNVFIKEPFEIKTLLKIFIYLISSSVGGIIGVNLSSKNKS